MIDQPGFAKRAMMVFKYTSKNLFLVFEICFVHIFQKHTTRIECYKQGTSKMGEVW